MRNRYWAAIRRSAMACMVVVTASAGGASATLLDRGPYLVYDDVLEITWARNANLPGRMLNWRDAHAWAANLVYAGYDDWRLPYASVKGGSGRVSEVVPCQLYSEVGCLDNEMGYMFYYNLGGKVSDDKTGTQTALGGQQLTSIHRLYWSDSEFPPWGAWFFVFDFGGQNSADYGFSDGTVWAVRPGDSAYVPEPSSLLLIGFGVLALGYTRRGSMRIRVRCYDPRNPLRRQQQRPAPAQTG